MKKYYWAIIDEMKPVNILGINDYKKTLCFLCITNTKKEAENLLKKLSNYQDGYLKIKKITIKL